MIEIFTRAGTIQVVSDFAGPLWPFRSIDDHLAGIDRWVDSQGVDALRGLARLVTDPPSTAELGDLPREDFDNCLGEVLCVAAERQPDAATGILSPLLDNRGSRPFAIDALGATGSQDALDRLRVLASSGLDPADIPRVDEAIREIEQRLSAS